jgi:predicted aminopeptidase
MVKIRQQAPAYLVSAGMMFLLIITACAGPSYYAQAVSGHMRLMGQRQDIADILDSSTADPEQQRKLKLSIDIREFAVNDLSLPDNNSYTQFVSTGQTAVTWNVVAAPEFSLLPKKWCFLASGCVTYRGYFKVGAAEKFANSLADKGFDTSVSAAIAYSTLGWFDDPLLDTMFQYSDDQLAAFIFHELAHQQLYVKGDTEFNEAYAGFVEEAGLTLWLQSSGRTEYRSMRQNASQASLQLNALLQTIRQELGQIYAGGNTEETMREAKFTVFAELVKKYQSLVDSQWEGHNYYKSMFSRDLNNASLALMNSYQGGSCAFEKLFRQAGGDLPEFHRLAAAKAGLTGDARSNWLNQPCEVIASNSDM